MACAEPGTQTVRLMFGFQPHFTTPHALSIPLPEPGLATIWLPFLLEFRCLNVPVLMGK